jgi:very-short-patch-repair endonuclease
MRDRTRGRKFRRQFPIDNCVVDFYCFESRLAVELEGSIHGQSSQIKKDKTKDAYLRRLGIRVLHVSNGLALEDPESFVRKVHEAARVSGTREDSA